MAIDLPIRKDCVDSGFSLMERHIDLNKHAFDLNEVPLIDLNVDFLHDAPPSSSLPAASAAVAAATASFSSAASASPLLHHGVLNTASCPKKGGWLELFQNMFGHESSRNLQVFAPMLGASAAFAKPLDQYSISALPNPNYQGLNGTVPNLRDRCANNGAVSNAQDRCANNGAVSNARDRCTKDAVADLRLRYANDATQNLRVTDGMSDLRDQCINSAIPNLNHRTTNDAIPNLNDHCVGYAIPNLNDHCVNDAPLSSDRSLMQNHDSGSSFGTTQVEHGLQRLSSPHRGSRRRSCKRPSHGPFLPFAPLMEASSSYGAFGQSDVVPVDHFVHEDICSNSSWGHAIMNGENLSKPLLHLDLNSQPLPCWGEELYEDSSMCMEQNHEQNHGPDSLRESGESPCNSGRTSELVVSNNMPETPVKVIDSPDWLPPGWITELKIRKAGSTAGTKDKYYKDPITGRRFRSRNEVASFLETGHGCKYKSQIPFVELSLDPMSASSLPNQDFTKDSLESARFPHAKYSAEAGGNFPYRKDSAAEMVESGRFPYRNDYTECASLFLDVSPNTVGSSCANLERISVKQEQDVLQDEQMSGANVAMEPCQLGVLMKSHHNCSKEDQNLHKSSNEPGSRSKRRRPSHKSSQGSATGHISSECRSMRSRSKTEQWKREEAKETSEDAKETHANHRSSEEQSKTQDAGNEGEQCGTVTIRSFPKANGSWSFLKVVENASEKESCPKPLLGNRAPPVRKIAKLTLKQERELLISLGQKLCRRASAPS